MVKSLGATPEPDIVALSTLAARRALALVAAVMHVPAVHATLLEQQGLLQPPTTPAVIMVEYPNLYNLLVAVCCIPL